MNDFDPYGIEDLDECVLKALDLFIHNPLEGLELPDFNRPLAVGSGNAAVTGRIICNNLDFVPADESTYKDKLESIPEIDGALLVSASGGKHAPVIARHLKEEDIPIILITCNPDSPAAEHADETIVSPKRPEPYTYNTSTYMGMILQHTKEDPEAIRNFIKKEVKPAVPDNLDDYDAFCLLVPEKHDKVRSLFLTKFDELFGPMINGRCFTTQQVKHAKTVVPSDTELFISFGYDNKDFGKDGNRLNIPLPDNAGPAAMMATGYYVIGKIQKQHPPYFKEHIKGYVEKASELFGQKISLIVD